MIKGRIITIHHGELTKQEFEYYPIWCEYYDPDELTALIDSGESSDFLHKELIERVENSTGQIHPYYTVAIEDSITREFLYVYCKVLIFTNKYEGYALVSRGKLLSFSVFYKNNNILLSLNRVLDEDNYENICLMTGQRPSGDVSLRYFLMCKLKNIPESEEVIVPISSS
ncbi:MAG: hypothetical protein D3909_10535 [Candidatus Electrothrix sp. ATG1]|nr:hypothetical protein [Candidatus Electrothrix sp. ATG1]MCI5207226.1 hypothetical protein [Candidatus Electrothrix sp. ATG2]